MTTPVVSPDPFSVILFYMIAAAFAGNTTLGTTHAFNRGSAFVSYLFLLKILVLLVVLGAPSARNHQNKTLCRERDSGNASGVHAL